VWTLEPNGLSLSCDEYIKTFNKFIEVKDLRENPSQEGVFNVKKTTNATVVQYVKLSK